MSVLQFIIQLLICQYLNNYMSDRERDEGQVIQIEEEGGLVTKHYRIVITIILKQTSSDLAQAAKGGI